MICTWFRETGSKKVFFCSTRIGFGETCHDSANHAKTVVWRCILALKKGW